jgi:hypothetical protein
MSRIDFEGRRRSLGNELFCLEVCIAGRRDEIVELSRQAEVIKVRIEHVNFLEAQERERGLAELIRMCNTPVWRYRAAEVC